MIRRALVKTIVLRPALTKRDEELERRGVGARLRPEEQQVAVLARRARLGDPVELAAGEGLGELAGVGGGGRGGDQHRIATPPSGRGGRSAGGRDGNGCRRCRGRYGARRARSSAGRRGTAPSRSSGRGRPGGACPDWRSPPAGNSCGSPSASRPGCRRRRSRSRRPRAAAPRPRRDRTNFPRWSCPSAFRGKRNSPCPGPPRTASSSGGTWKTSDLPDAVGVVTSTFSPRRTAAIPSAWWRPQARHAPPPQSAGDRLRQRRIELAVAGLAPRQVRGVEELAAEPGVAAAAPRSGGRGRSRTGGRRRRTDYGALPPDGSTPPPRGPGGGGLR